jgi:hypothetical protein
LDDVEMVDRDIGAATENCGLRETPDTITAQSFRDHHSGRNEQV